MATAIAVPNTTRPRAAEPRRAIRHARVRPGQPYVPMDRHRCGRASRDRGQRCTQRGDDPRDPAPSADPADPRAQADPTVRYRGQAPAPHRGRGYRGVLAPAGDPAGGRRAVGAIPGDRGPRRRQSRAGGVDRAYRRRCLRRFDSGGCPGTPSTTLRRALYRPGRCRRALRGTGDPARQDRGLQGKDRGHQVQGSKSTVLPHGRGGGGRYRGRYPAVFRGAPVSVAVRRFRGGSAEFHAAGDRGVALHAALVVADPAVHRGDRLRPVYRAQALTGSAPGHRPAGHAPTGDRLDCLQGCRGAVRAHAFDHVRRRRPPGGRPGFGRPGSGQCRVRRHHIPDTQSGRHRAIAGAGHRKHGPVSQHGPTDDGHRRRSRRA